MLNETECNTPFLGKRYEYSGIKCHCGNDILWDTKEKKFLKHKCGELPKETDPNLIRHKAEEVNDEETC